MYDLVLVKVVHTSGDLLGPLHQLLRMNLLTVPEEVEESAVRTVLHHDAEHGGLDTNSPERDNDDRIYRFKVHSLELDNVGMVEFPQVYDVRLELLLHLLHGHLFPLVLPHEDGPLCPGAEPLQLLYGFKWNLPVVLLHLWSLPLPDHHPHRLEAANKSSKPANIRY